MKLCSKCKIKEVRGKGQTYCSECHNIYQKEYYKKHPNSIDESNKKRKKIIRDYIMSQKNFPCMDCGKNYPYYVLDFDHKKDKEFNLSIAINKIYSLEKIKKEIEKCDLVCANCHRLRTFKDKYWVVV